LGKYGGASRPLGFRKMNVKNILSRVQKEIWPKGGLHGP